VTPDVSVVITTRDRPDRLRRVLASLERQTLPRERFEVIVVDDASGPETAAVLGEHDVRAIRREVAGGPGAGRNSGWRESGARHVAFTDDDCEVAPGWLEAFVEAAERHPGAFLQGRTLPLPGEAPGFGPFSHTIRIEALSRGFETANILYPRELLERLGGFDEAFGASGEDTDLGWRALAAGAEAVFVPEALAYHAVVQLGPVGMLRRAARWHEAPLVYKRHPELRRTLVLGVFWNREHAEVAAALAALALRRRSPWLAAALAAPYVERLVKRRSGPLLAPYIVLRDAIEIATLVRGSLRYRTLVV
jgi:glycosyltransferase involved in cell wall biosynthesis